MLLTISWRHSGAIHLMGTFPEPVLVYARSVYTSRDIPKSEILQTLPSATRMLRVARSRWTT